MRSSVVLPDPLRPDSARRSPRSTLKETPCSSGTPATCFSRPDAITTAIRRCYGQDGCRMTDFAESEVRVFDARRSAHDAKFTEGRDGWLFLDHDDNRVMDQHRGQLLLSDDQLEVWRDALERRAAWRARLGGAPYLLLIAPDAQAVYPEK